MLHYVSMFLVGLLVGLIARFIMPGSQSMGFILTGLLGIAGAFVGGTISNLFNKPMAQVNIDSVSLFWSVVGAMVVLWLWKKLF